MTRNLCLLLALCLVLGREARERAGGGGQRRKIERRKETRTLFFTACYAPSPDLALSLSRNASLSGERSVAWQRGPELWTSSSCDSNRVCFSEHSDFVAGHDGKSGEIRSP